MFLNTAGLSESAECITNPQWEGDRDVYIAFLCYVVVNIPILKVSINPLNPEIHLVIFNHSTSVSRKIHYIVVTRSAG